MLAEGLTMGDGAPILMVLTTPASEDRAMPTPPPVYQAVFDQVRTTTQAAHLGRPAVQRLALLVTGLLAARSCVLAQVAAELRALALTQASSAESIARRLRRTLGDLRLTPQRCYEPLVREVLDWPALLQGQRRVVLIVDESSKADVIHLFRVGLAYWGGSVPLAWAVWEQNTPLPDGQYWATVDAVLARVAALLPFGLEVLVLADRAYDVPHFVDRLTALGWHWVVRCKAKGSLRFRDSQGHDRPLRLLLQVHVKREGQRWKGRGQVFKHAGWRPASVIAIWATGYAEALVVLTDLPPRWEVVAWYGRRFWIEPSFRTDKSHGWQWEACQVQGLAHHQTLLVAMAWATLLVLCVGQEEVAAWQAALRQRLRRAQAAGRRLGKPQPARESLFTLGLRRTRGWLYRTLDEAVPWRLPHLTAPSWKDVWYHAQAYAFIFETVRL